MTRITKPALLAVIPVWFSLVDASHAASLNAGSCSLANVQSAISSAANGDTVIVPAGNCTWSSALAIGSKPIMLQGAGIGATIINYTGSGYMISLTQHASITTRISGFDMRGFHGTVRAITTSGSPSSAAFRIDHNRFYSSSGDATFITTRGNGPGLIDHNVTVSDASPNEHIHNEGNGAGNTAGWFDAVVPGGPDMVYIEDNTFTYNISGNPAYFYGASALQSYYGARTVFRHNQLNNMQVDQHGTPGMVGARWWEIYENTIFTGANSAQCCYIVLRGGSGVVFNNHHTGTNAVTGSIQLFEEDSGYPAQYQVGRGINQTLSPAYIWGNDADMSVGAGSSNVVQGRDFFVSISKLASFLRQQSSTDSVSTSYQYTPYTYPHPLQSGTQTTTTSVQPPTIMSIVLR